MKHQAQKTKFQMGMESLLNASESPLYTRQELSSSSIKQAAEGKKKKKNEEKERQKARMELLDSK